MSINMSAILEINKCATLVSITEQSHPRPRTIDRGKISGKAVFPPRHFYDIWHNLSRKGQEYVGTGEALEPPDQRQHTSPILH